ncbi:hypothetical protein ABZW30_16615 [Kitasatospora sp. NPDC004669]
MAEPVPARRVVEDEWLRLDPVPAAAVFDSWENRLRVVVALSIR